MNRSKKLNKQMLYEIYRACRLCGAAAGYRMPIIQNIVQLDEDEIELKEKIRECLQLEVHSDDKMPPLICENCVDKVDDFYEFLSTCRETNIKTRKQLGLPLQRHIAPPPPKVIHAPVKVAPVPAKVAPVAKKVVCKDIGTETCMLGLIEASAVKQDVYIIGKQPEVKKPKGKVKKEEIKTENTVKTEIPPVQRGQTLKDIKLVKDNTKKREASPKRTTRQSSNLDEVPLSKIQEEPKNQLVTKPGITKPGPRSRKIETKEDPPPKVTRAKEKDEPLSKLSKKEDETSKAKNKKEKDNESLNKLKRVKEKDAKTDFTPPPAKKARSSEPPKPSPQTSKTQKSSKPLPKSVQTISTASKPVQPDGVQCPACVAVLKNIAGFKNHMHYAHPVTFTPNNLACNACRAWFPTIEEAIAHHKKHSHYKCLRCHNKFKTGVLYHQHIENKRCVPEEERPDVKCAQCRRTFPTELLLKEHRCSGLDARPGGKCSKCNRNYSLLKNLVKHESGCGAGKRVTAEPQPVIEPEVKKILLKMSVRITRCDDLLQYGPVVSACTVPHRYGLDRKMSYPYLPKLRVIKKPTFSPFRAIQDEIKEDFGTDDFSWADFEDIEFKTVKKLSTLCLKVVFSSKMLGDREILDEIEIARRLALKKRIDSIIFKMDDASSTNSDSILDKNAIAKTFEVVNDDVVSDDNKNHSDATVFDKTSHNRDEGKGSDAEVGDFDRDLIENHDNPQNLGTAESKLKNKTSNSNILSNTDVDINKVCDNSNFNVKETSNQNLELSKSLRDDVTYNLKTIDPNQTDILNKIANTSDEKLSLDSVRFTNDSPPLINTENSTNDATKATESNNLSKYDVDTDENITVNTTITEKTSLSSSNLENKDSNIDSKNTDNTNRSRIDTLSNCESMDDDACQKDGNSSIQDSHETVIEANKSVTNNDKLSTSDSDLTRNIKHIENMETDTDTDVLYDNEAAKENPQISETNEIKLHDNDHKAEVESMDIDTPCGIESANLENTTTVLENSETESIEKKTDINNEQSADSSTKNPEIIKNTMSNTKNNSGHDSKPKIDEIKTISPQKANKSLDFSVTGILNHVTSKSMDSNLENAVDIIKKDENAVRNTESIENNTTQDGITENDKNNDNNNQLLDNSSLNDRNTITNNDSVINNENYDELSIHTKDDVDDTTSLNSISTTFTEKTDDNLSLNADSKIEKSDKFNENDLSEDEKKLMAELDEQIGETNDKIDKLNENRDLNYDGYHFD